MDESERVIAQADNLMRRHGLVATPPAGGDTDDDGLPVLTDIVAPVAAISPPDPALPESPAAPILPPDRVDALAREMLFDRLPRQRQALAQELAVWLDDELPQVVLRVLDSITDQLIEQVTAEARAILLPRLQMVIEEQSQPSRHADPEV